MPTLLNGHTGHSEAVRVIPSAHKWHIRHGGAAHSRDRLKAAAHAFVELCAPSLLVPGLSSIQAEEQQIFRIESDRNRMQPDQGSDEQAGGDDEQQRDRNLSCDEYLGESEATHSRCDGAGFLERGRHVYIRRLYRWDQAEKYAGHDGNNRGEEENTAVDCGAQRKILNAVREEPGEKADSGF